MKLDNSIMMWGPTSAGKSMLLNAFAKDLERINQLDDEFKYIFDELIDMGDPEPKRQPIRAEEKFPLGSSDITKREYEFQRIPSQESDILNKHTHYISTVDLPGADCIQFIEDPDSMPLLKGMYLEAKNIIAVFDLAITKDDGLPHDLTPDQYGHLFNEFLDLIIQDGPNAQEKRNVALCLTKIDVLGFDRHPDKLLRDYFGKEVYEKIKRYEGDTDRNLRVKSFATSAVGFVLENSKKMPNINSAGDAVKKGGSQWKPYTVVEPFFWIFENIEIERLGIKNSGLFSRSNNYKKYPTRISKH